MPEVGDYSRHLQGVDTRLQRSSHQGIASGCLCGFSVPETYHNCSSCSQLIQDVKPDQKSPLQNLQWMSAAEIPPAPAPTPAAPAATEVAIPFGSSSLTRVTRARSSTSTEREHQARSSPRTVVTPSPYLHSHGQRGRPPNGSRTGPVGFRGVRQRKGVRGYLVEIRPPKWKKTIWLGTYNSDREAAGAYDAGIFYTNKKTRYNFPALEGTFPPLPPTLRLDNADHSLEIKTFVQQEAREAAVKVRSFPIPTPEATPSDTRTDTSGGDPSNILVSSTTTSSEDCTSEEMGLPIPADDDEWLNLQQMIAGAPAFVDFTRGWSVYDSKQEELDFEPVNLGFMHSLP